MRLSTVILVAAFALACPARQSELTASQREAIRGEIEQALREAYDLSKPKPSERMLALYPSNGRVISANSGRVMASRDSLATGIKYFWDNVGTNMRNPRWVWDRFYVDVLSPTAAVVTATYRVPHRNPQNQPHELGGAMTMVFERRDGRWVILQEHLSDLPSIPDSVQTGMPTHDHH